MKGYAIAATDGRIGTVSDFLFDDTNWQIRWLIVDTGDWLSGRKVLLTPMMLGQLDPKGHAFTVELTMQQVKDSPDVDTDRPVSRQIETNIYDYYGWSPYWGNGSFTDSYGYVGATWTEAPKQGIAPTDKNMADARKSADDPHLRSIEAVTGYHIHANDGEIGHVDDFILEDADWSVHYLVVDTKNWWPGKKVLISPKSVRNIDWLAKVVNVDADRQRVKDSPAYDASTTVDEAYDDAFLTYYGLKLVAA
ncbi:PRC-barrel domain-containing protein [Methyloferula stellata]|uniref:PRC-barrel domain containing protein n=1 Tax=Methyloferula stellata TaxID=876270 RepID=UPI0003652A99|nr:PRC-barrel domain-containing protein [Methyloferula stellata]